MATTLSTIIADARVILLETSANFWTDAELLSHLINGAKDMWRGIMDLYQDHFATIDSTNVSVVANTTALTGVPTDVFRIIEIRPRTLNDANRGLIFKPRTLTHPDFVQAQAMPAAEAVSNVVYYAVVNAGAPVGAPSIRIAPQLGTAVPLTLVYVPTLGTLTSGSDNPIPGESDMALKAFTVAYARAKERPARDPDPEYISIYATEKASVLMALTPRSVQEPEYVSGMWEPAAPGSGASGDFSPW